MKHIVLGMLAHVDAGKTTLSENFLLRSGVIKKAGRVDSKDVYFDTDTAERDRGITIYSKTAELNLNGTEVTLMDTPGHVDFSGEMERTLSVLDGAILLISGNQGIQSHTRTLLNLLNIYQIPTIIFVNKMDLGTADKAKVLMQIKKDIPGAVDFSNERSLDERDEDIATADESLMDDFFSKGQIEEEKIAQAVNTRKVFPVFWGSALTGDGTDELVEAVTAYFSQKETMSDFAARVFKITHDSNNERLTWVRILGGELKNRQTITTSNGDEKVNQIRVYSSEKFTTCDTALAGRVYAITGLMGTTAGDGLGALEDLKSTCLEPVMTYTVVVKGDTDDFVMFNRLKALEEENPLLRVSWDENLKKSHVCLMGEIETQILRDKIWKLYKVDVEFSQGHIVYKETIAKPVEGVGHYEPLRHYAEVHLLLEPAERGSGITVDARVSTDDLELNWQRLIMTNVMETEHPGVLTGSDITDIKISVIAGRAHEKHTEGGDFRQATYRAIRHGLMKAENILLEPYYDFVIEVPQEHIGRAMTDVTAMEGKFTGPEPDATGELMVIKGSAPVLGLNSYGATLSSYTSGNGRLSLTAGGYFPVKNPENIIEELHYDPESDLKHCPSSVFCSHGAGFVVPWNEVENYMHLPLAYNGDETDYAQIYRDYDAALLEVAAQKAQTEAMRKAEAKSKDAYVMDQELQDIFARTFGNVKKRTSATDSDLGYEKVKMDKSVSMANKLQKPSEEYLKNRKVQKREDYLIVDGYNIIFAWQDLSELSRDNIDSARDVLLDRLDNYAAFSGIKIIVVFDAYKRKGATLNKSAYNNIEVVFTMEGQLADHYIEQTVRKLTKKYSVAVATNDGMEQLTISSGGALRMSALELLSMIKSAEKGISERLEKKD